MVVLDLLCKKWSAVFSKIYIFGLCSSSHIFQPKAATTSKQCSIPSQVDDLSIPRCDLWGLIVRQRRNLQPNGTKSWELVPLCVVLELLKEGLPQGKVPIEGQLGIPMSLETSGTSIFDTPQADLEWHISFQISLAHSHGFDLGVS